MGREAHGTVHVQILYHSNSSGSEDYQLVVYRVHVNLCRFAGKPQLLLIQQRNFLRL